MRIRFLQLTQSGVPEYPFQPGQVIDVAEPAPWLLRFVDGVHAEVIRDTTEEAAVVSEPEMAVVLKRKPGRPPKVA